MANMQVDKHVEHLCLSFQGPRDVALAKRLAKRGLQPTELAFKCAGRTKPGLRVAAMKANTNAFTALLGSEHHWQLLTRATDIRFGLACKLHNKALHVSQ
jgi:hypothetical protein